MLYLLKKNKKPPLSDKKILEIRCGNGTNLLNFIRWGVLPENLYANDLRLEQINVVKNLIPHGTFYHGNAEKLPWENEFFDIVLQATVFSSIFSHAVNTAIAREMLRVTKSDGLIMWYDLRYNNPWNPDVHGISKKEIFSLFPNCEIEIRPSTLVPQMARILPHRSWVMCYLAEKVPFFCSHYLAVIRK